MTGEGRAIDSPTDEPSIKRHNASEENLVKAIVFLVIELYTTIRRKYFTKCMSGKHLEPVTDETVVRFVLGRFVPPACMLKSTVHMKRS